MERTCMGFFHSWVRPENPKLAAHKLASGDLAASFLWPWSPLLMHTALRIMIFLMEAGSPLCSLP